MFLKKTYKGFYFLMAPILKSFIFRFSGRKLRIFILKNFFKIKIGENVSILRSFDFFRGGNISIGENCFINEGCYFDDLDVISIEKNTWVAQQVTILTATHCVKNMEQISSPVTIKEYCWIGARSIILPGVTVEKGSVVGAGAVVTKNVPEYVIVAGNPAREIKKREISFPYKVNHDIYIGKV